MDPWFIVSKIPIEALLIRTAREVNDSKTNYVVDQLIAVTASMVDPVIACLGLTFKPDIDDLRESPVMEVVHKLAPHQVGKILAVEPHIKSMPADLANFGDIELVSAETAIPLANIIVKLVNHKEFHNIDRGLLADKQVIDTRGVWW